MPDAPVPARPVAQATPVAREAPAREAPRSKPSLPTLTVRYYRRMRPNKVYPVVVRCETAGRVRAAEPVVLRLLMAGAQVVPSEQTLDPGQPGAHATFFVTPLARGWLHGERLEVVQHGKKVQEIRLPCKVTTQCMTWCFLALAFLVPYFIVPYFTTSPITYGKKDAKDGKEPKAVKEEDKDSKKDAKDGKEPKAANEEDKDGPKKSDKPEAATPGQALEWHLRDNCPHVWPVIKDYLPAVGDALEGTRVVIGEAYSLGYFSVKNNSFPLMYWTIVFFLALTVLSWLLHLEKRKRRVVRAA